MKRDDVGEDFAKRRDERTRRLFGHAVEVKPLAKEAVGLEPLGGDLEEVLREEIGNAGDPGIRRLRDDDVVGRFAAL